MDLDLLPEEPHDRHFFVRRAEIEDGKGFSDLLNSQGGQALFRATFGKYMSLSHSLHFIPCCLSLASPAFSLWTCQCLSPCTYFFITSSPIFGFWSTSLHLDQSNPSACSCSCILPFMSMSCPGMFNFSNLVEYSYLSIYCTYGDDEGVGFAALSDSNYANGEFDKSIDKLKGIVPCNVTNTLFLTFLVANTKAVPGIDTPNELMVKTFVTFPEVDFIFWYCPTTAKVAPYMQNIFTEIDSNRLELAGAVVKGYKVYVAHRSRFMPKLMVREAVIEDNDDLLPILQASNPSIVADQDEFFLAQLIQTQNERNKIFVGVERNRPVGMLSTSMDVNVGFIRNTYDLNNFADIITEITVQTKSPNLIILVCGNLSLIDDSALYNLAMDVKCAYIDADADTEYDLDDQEPSTVQEGMKHLEGLINDAMNSTNNPQTCIVSGFPRSKEEAEMYLTSGFAVDAIVVIDGDDTGEVNDESLTSHIEGVSIWKEKFTAPEEQLAVHNQETQFIVLTSEGHSDLEVATSIENSVKDIIRIRDQEIYEAKTRVQEGPIANAFAITVFAITEKYQSRAEDLLRVAFEEHPNLQYCMLLLPNTAAQLAICKFMSFVRLKPGASFDQSLYIVHRDSMLANDLLSVRRYLPSYADALKDFVVPMGEAGEEILEGAKSALKDNSTELNDNPGEVCFVVTVANDIVGVVTLSRKIITTEDIEWIRANFQVDEFINYERHRARAQAAITNFALSPIFSRWSRFILREVMRYYGKSLFYYQCENRSSVPEDLIADVLPVRPRRRMQTQASVEDGNDQFVNRPSSYGPTRHDPLYFTTKRLLSDPRTVLPTRIVVIGGNRCAYSVLETLCFIPYLHLVNIFFVVDGTPSNWKYADNSTSKKNGRKPLEKDTESLSTNLYPCDEDGSFEHELDSLGLSGRVTLVNGRLTDIDRSNKVVVISDSIPLEYDVLVLTPPSEDSTFRNFENTRLIHPRQLQERGVYGLGSETSDLAVSQWLFGPRGPRTPGVVVYGSGLIAWSAVGRLLEKGLEPERLVWILPRTEFIDGELGHETIDESAQNNLSKCGIKMLVGFKICDINFSESNSVYSVNVVCIPGAPSFEKYEERKRRDRERAERKAKLAAERNEEFWNIEETKDETMPYDEVVMCGTLIMCEKFNADVDVFSAINDSGLVYDGGIVVDSNFCSVDPCIFAAGDCTRFSRQHGNNVLQHASINSRELGTYVAVKVIESHLDPQLDGEIVKNESAEPISISIANGMVSDSSSMKRSSLPIFSLPRTTSMTLPGGYYFLQSRLPDIGKQEIVSMVTGGPETDRICVVKTNSLGLVVEISYIGNLIN